MNYSVDTLPTRRLTTNPCSVLFRRLSEGWQRRWPGASRYPMTGSASTTGSSNWPGESPCPRSGPISPGAKSPPRDLQEKLFRGEIWEGIADHDPFAVADVYFEKSRALSTTNRLMFVDLKTYLLNDHLRKVDRMTMAHSLEARVPYLDHRVVELAVRLPSHYKVNLFQTKRILKHLARPFLPKDVISGKKKGLTSPIAGWISSHLREYIRDTMQGGILDELFDAGAIGSLLQDHYDRKVDHSRTIWGLLTLQVWSKNLTGSASHGL